MAPAKELLSLAYLGPCQTHVMDIFSGSSSYGFSREGRCSVKKGLQTCNFIKKGLQHRYFPVNITKFLRTPFWKNICERLLLVKNV